MFSKFTQVLIVLLLFLMGPFVAHQGYKDFRNSRRLIAEAKTVNGGVIKASETERYGRFRKLFKRYTLEVAFLPRDGEMTFKTLSVNHDTYKLAAANGTVKIHFLPSDPTICAAGEKVGTAYIGLLSGSFMLILATTLSFQLVRSQNDQNKTRRVDSIPRQSPRTSGHKIIIKA